MSDFWRDRPTLVTGGTGLVGSWLVRRLLRGGRRRRLPGARLGARSRARSRDAATGVSVRPRRRARPALLERALGEYEIDTVIHLAAQTIVGHRQPQSDLDVRDQHRRHLGTCSKPAAARPSVKQIVVASSDKAYGDQESCPTTKTTPLTGAHPYDVSKSCADLIAQAYADTYGLPVAITRCGNFYGGGDLNWNRIVPGTIRSVLRGERPVIRSDGQFVRDYFYVEDGAAAYMLLAEKLAGESRDLRGQAFNFSNEIQVTVLDLVNRILPAS